MALRPVSKLPDYAFPDGAWDVRGWTVRTEHEDRKVGKVEGMLLDRSGSLRYLDVDLGFLKKHVLVPLDHAHADQESETVWIEGMTRDQLEDVPEYALDPETLDEDYERRLDAVYGGTAASTHQQLLAPEEREDGTVELERMSVLEDEYRVAGQDPRGWTVVTGEGEKVGRVAELLMEPAAMKARFLDTAVDEKRLGLEPVDRHILLPVDRVRLDRSDKHVIVSGLLAHDLADYPQYNGLPVARATDREIAAYFDRVGRSDEERGVEPRPARDAPPVDWRQSTLRHFFRTRTRPIPEEERNG